MKKNILQSFAIVISMLFLTESSEGRIWRVNHESNFDGNTFFGENYGGSFSNPVFKEIQDAIDWNDVSSGGRRDTIHVEGAPAASNYNDVNITKSVVLIGPGYFLNSNPKTSNDEYEAIVGNLIFSPGSEKSIACGLKIKSFASAAQGHIILAADSIIIKRCWIENDIAFGIASLQSVTILENFFSDAPGNALTVTNLTVLAPIALIFNNNICKKTLVLSFGMGQWPLLQCRNNVFDGPPNTPTLDFSTSDFSNNIIAATNATLNISAGPGVIANNTGTQASQFGGALTNGNNIAAMTSVFAGTGSEDGYYEVKSTSVQAHLSGNDNNDRGVFGGAIISNRYTLSGLTAIPVIYEVTTTGVVTSSGLPVTIKARTIK